MQPAYLTGPTVYLRALLIGDRDESIAWHGSPFPINAARAEELLRETHTNPWAPPVIQLAIVRRADDRLIGSATIETPSRRVGELSFHLAPWLEDPDTLRADALRIAIPWLRDEMELMAVTVLIANDETATIAAAEGLGMVMSGRRREALARPHGRVDLRYYQALNPKWKVGDRDA